MYHHARKLAAASLVVMAGFVASRLLGLVRNVVIAQQFGTQAAQLVSLEYAFTPRLSVKATTSSRGNSSIDLQWHRRY